MSISFSLSNGITEHDLVAVHAPNGDIAVWERRGSKPLFYLPPHDGDVEAHPLLPLADKIVPGQEIAAVSTWSEHSGTPYYSWESEYLNYKEDN